MRAPKILKVICGIIGVVLVCACMYGLFRAAKSMSYYFAYESMVERTVRDMVKPEYLK